METWIKINCPFCNQKNWLNNGDENDMTVPDIEACQCWNCNEKFALNCEDEDIEDADIEDLFAEKGKKSPS